MNNQDFCKVIFQSFIKFLETSSRSNEKLKILHGSIAKDLFYRLNQNYSINSLGFNDGKEYNIMGRYIDKKVDISISKNNKQVAGIAVKFVMQNYLQNSNNYFENMLGETANIRSNKIKYFQILIIPKKLPYYKNNSKFKKWEIISKHNIEKYIKLSKDNENLFFHTPDKTLICLIDLPKINVEIRDKKDYIKYYKKLGNFSINFCDDFKNSFDDLVIYNNYEKFIEKITYSILSI